MMSFRKTLNKKSVAWFSCLMSLLILPVVNAVELNIATVNNGHMVEMQNLTQEFEKAYPNIKLNWHIFNEGSLRMRAIADIASEGRNYDVVTIGMYETPIWAQRGWLQELTPNASYQINDLLPAVRNGLSYKGKLYAAPFYGESSMLMYRKDLLKKAGLTLEDRPTWEQIRQTAQAMHDPSNGVYGICLRGREGWGDNMALVSTMVNSFGGRWFDMNWQPQLTSQPWRDAVNFYVNLLRDYGPPQSELNSFNEILALVRDGKCGMWVDASIAASFITNAKKSKIADQWGFAQAPYQVTYKGANWLWAWALAIPKGTLKSKEAQTFISWATSQAYIELVARKSGWANVPTGTRESTYKNKSFLAATGQFSIAELAAMNSADPVNNTLLPSPYQGVQFVAIPEFIAIGGAAGQNVAEALTGKITVEQALNNTQKIAEREMRRGGYYNAQSSSTEIQSGSWFSE